MIIHLRKMPDGILQLSGSESAEALGLEEAGVEASGELSYELDAGLSEGGLWVHGKLSLPVRLECVGCLEKFDSVLEVPDFALQIPLEGKESVDLTEWVREDILLALPPYPKCNAGENQSCPAGLPPKGSGPEEGSAPEVSPLWSALDQLKTKN